MVLALLTPALEALPNFRAYTSDHADIAVRLVDGELETYWENDFMTVDGELAGDKPLPRTSIRALGVFDAATPALIRPEGSQLDHLGVEAGEPIYILPSGGTPNTLPYLGLASEAPSLSAIDGLASWRVSLVDMVGPEDGVFNLYSDVLNPNMSTYDGIDSDDYITMGPGDHFHFNWAFSHLGGYDLFLKFEALDGDGNTILEVTEPFRFHITDGGGYETYADWRRTFFLLEDLDNDAISGPMADPVGDGRTNLERYAFGKFPEWQFEWVEHGGEDYPGVRVTVREGSEDMEIFLEHSYDLTDWDAVGVVEVSRESIFHFPGLEERVYRLEDNTPERAFFRARVEWQEPTE